MSLEETIVTALLLHQEKGNIPVLVKSFIYIWLRHIKIISVLLQCLCNWDSELVACSLQLPIFINTKKHTDESIQHHFLLLPACIWSRRCEIHRWFTGLQKPWCPMYPSVKAEDLEWTGFLEHQGPVSGAWRPWCQLTEAANEEGWGASGVPFETGAPGFHKRRPGIHRNSSVLQWKRMKSAPALCHVAVFQSSVMSNMAHTKAVLPVCPLPACLPSQREMLLHDMMKLYMSRCISFRQNALQCRGKKK